MPTKTTEKVTEATESAPVVENSSPHEPLRDLFVWRSLSRPPIVLEKEAYTTVVSVCILLSVVVAFFQEWFLILLTWGGLFLIVSLSKLPPEEVEHRITTQGVISLGHEYLWIQLGPFWFTDKGNYKLLHLSEEDNNFFGTHIIIVPNELEEKVRNTLVKYLPYIEVPEKSRMDKLSDWLAAKLNLESPRTTS